MKRIILAGLLGLMAAFVVVYSSLTPQITVAALKITPTPGPSHLVSIPMADGLKIKGDFYPAVDNDFAPALLLLHQHFGSGVDWKDFAIPLAQKGYTVLAIDMRGQGITGGKVDWHLAESDAVALMAWLREQPGIDPDRVAVAGASIGANLALQACAEDDACHVVIALSPGLDYFGIGTKDTVDEMQNKSILLVASQNDPQSAESTKYLTSLTSRSVNSMTRIYASSNRHGTALFSFPDLAPLMMDWLDLYNMAS